MPGTPDASAYAMPTGTSMVVITRPATRSSRSQDGLYSRKAVNPGSQRIQPFRFACVTSRTMRPGSSGGLARDSVMEAIRSLNQRGWQSFRA